jgi:hypothetical protein
VHEELCKDQISTCGNKSKQQQLSKQPSCPLSQLPESSTPRDAIAATPIDRNTHYSSTHDASSVKSLGKKSSTLYNNFIDTGSVRTLNALTSRPKSMDLVRLFQVKHKSLLPKYDL